MIHLKLICIQNNLFLLYTLVKSMFRSEITFTYFITPISLALTYRETKKLTASIVQHVLMNTIASIPFL